MPEELGALRQRMTDELALDFAKARTHGDVFMDGRHNPLPSEKRTAARFMEMLEFVGLLGDTLLLARLDGLRSRSAALEAALFPSERIVDEKLGWDFVCRRCARCHCTVGPAEGTVPSGWDFGHAPGCEAATLERTREG